MTEIVGEGQQPLESVRAVRPKADSAWLVVMLSIIGAMIVAIIFSDAYQEAFREIIPGLKLTLYLTLGAFMVSMPLGLFIGIGRLSKNPVINTVSRVYIEFVRGMPMLVFIFVVAFVLTRDVADLLGIKTRSIPMEWRGGAALCLFYAAFIAEVFRAGITSVQRGQREAGMSMGLSRAQVFRLIVWPQALKNVMPA